MNSVNSVMTADASNRFAQCIAASQKVRWQIEEDVIRGRQFDRQMKWLPDGLSLVDRLEFLSADQQRFLSQVQGRTYANMFGLVERFICAKVMEVSRDYVLGDQVALEALVRFTDEELKHQALFRRLEEMAADAMPAGYAFAPDPNEVAGAVLGKSTWAVLGLTLHIELFTLVHYRESIAPDAELSPLWKDVFLFHWKEESQHAVMDELEWLRENDRMTVEERDRGVSDLIDLVAAVDGILQAQARLDADYFIANCGRPFTAGERECIAGTVIAAYRWQYIVSGVQLPRFAGTLARLVTPAQKERINAALAPLLQ